MLTPHKQKCSTNILANSLVTARYISNYFENEKIQQPKKSERTNEKKRKEKKYNKIEKNWSPKETNKK